MRKEYDFSQGKRGAVVASAGKTRITIMLDDDVIEFFRAYAEAAGAGYQTLINTALRATMANAKTRKSDDEPVTVAKLRTVLQEVLLAAPAPGEAFGLKLLQSVREMNAKEFARITQMSSDLAVSSSPAKRKRAAA